jgi:hypothetical protein
LIYIFIKNENELNNEKEKEQDIFSVAVDGGWW